MSKAFDYVIERLQGDWEFIEKFLENPEMALNEYPELEEEERSALATRDITGLMSLGLGDREVLALSGAHSKNCDNTTKPV